MFATWLEFWAVYEAARLPTDSLGVPWTKEAKDWAGTYCNWLVSYWLWTRRLFPICCPANWL